MSVQILDLNQYKANLTQVVFIKAGDIQFASNWPTLNVEIEAQLKALLLRFSQKSLSGNQVLGSNPEILIVPFSEKKGLDHLELIRVSSYQAVQWAASRGLDDIQFHLPAATLEELLAFAEGARFANYSFEKYKFKASTKPKVNVSLLSHTENLGDVKKLLKNQKSLFDNLFWCRDLVNEPGSSLTPQIYVERIEKAFSSKKSVKLNVRDHKQLSKEGFNGLLTVGAGGHNPPAMVTLEYRPKGASQDVVLGLVGKGVTFDTGGISIKPPTGMWEMRMDMAGSATVLAAFKTIVELGLKINVVAVVCITENRPGLNACLPGDIFKAKNGKTIMVDNTDAEGRLILTDGLWEANDRGATHIVDLATLTGAIIRALGMSVAGLFANDQNLADSIIHNGKKSGEKFWQMPLEAEYSDALEDKVADYKNIGGDAGAITAGLFLQEFVPTTTAWAHLDIAGTAFTTKDWKYFGWGATGWGVRSLVNLAEELAQ